MMFLAQKKFITIIKTFLDMKRTVFTMKQMFSSTNRVFSLMIMILVASMTFTLVGCSDDNGRTETPLSDKYSNIPESEKVSFEGYAGIVGGEEGMTKNDFLYSEDSDIVNVWVDASSRFIYLPKDHPQYNEHYKRLLKKDGRSNLLKITILDKQDSKGFPVINVEELPSKRKQELLERYEKSEINDDNQISLRTYSSSISYQQIKEFFNEMADMNCGDYPICPCIPFQYAIDGCYSRAHWMRKKFKEKFGFDCNKVFTYGDLRAETQAGCTQRWRYHVAPLVDVGNTSYVIDPGLFTKPVRLGTWLDKQRGTIKKVDIRKGYAYMPDFENGEYYTDNNYRHTIKMNEEYAFLSGCSDEDWWICKLV